MPLYVATKVSIEKSLLGPSKAVVTVDPNLAEKNVRPNSSQIFGRNVWLYYPRQFG